MASCLPNEREVSFEWVEHFVQHVKLQKGHVVLLFDGHSLHRKKLPQLLLQVQVDL